MIDEVKLRKKKDEEINYMLSESLQKAWTTFEPMLAIRRATDCSKVKSLPSCSFSSEVVRSL
jgi:hypothetical protein